MSEVKIARFVGLEACKSIFSEESTFVLRSPKHYRRLYEISEGATAKGDGAEGCANTVDGGTAEFTGWVASCWTILNGSEPTGEEWDIFKKDNQNIMAIVSTPRRVCGFLDRVLETNKERTERRYPFHPVQHGKVGYDPVHVNHTNITDVVPFTKRAQFSKEKEYRFVLSYAWPYLIDSFIFCGGIDYMEKCFVNPEMSKEQKEKLQLIIMNAIPGYVDFENKKMGDIIANVEVLLDP
jgi:hypothetical protein